MNTTEESKMGRIKPMKVIILHLSKKHLISSKINQYSGLINAAVNQHCVA
jgi:hypothetical protein